MLHQLYWRGLVLNSCTQTYLEAALFFLPTEQQFAARHLIHAPVWEQQWESAAHTGLGHPMPINEQVILYLHYISILLLHLLL